LYINTPLDFVAEYIPSLSPPASEKLQSIRVEVRRVKPLDVAILFVTFYLL
jgi:hypothetical protein